MIRCVNWAVAMYWAQQRALKTGRRQVVTKAAPYYIDQHLIPATWTVQEAVEVPRHRLPVFAR